MIIFFYKIYIILNICFGGQKNRLNETGLSRCIVNVHALAR